MGWSVDGVETQILLVFLVAGLFIPQVDVILDKGCSNDILLRFIHRLVFLLWNGLVALYS